MLKKTSSLKHTIIDLKGILELSCILGSQVEFRWERPLLLLDTMVSVQTVNSRYYQCSVFQWYKLQLSKISGLCLDWVFADVVRRVGGESILFPIVISTSLDKLKPQLYGDSHTSLIRDQGCEMSSVLCKVQMYKHHFKINSPTPTHSGLAL